MLVLLGDQLIRDAGIAVFELVKNAYDADATRVDVTLSHVADRTKGQIIIEDEGCGMGWEQKPVSATPRCIGTRRFSHWRTCEPHRINES